MDNFKSDLISAMEIYFGRDAKRIDHARRVTEYTEKLLDLEGGDVRIVIASGVLHDIGIHEAERKYNSTGGKYQQIEGPSIAREMLQRLAFGPAEIDQICDIIAYHHSIGPMRDNLNFRILYDADWLVNLPDEYDVRDKDELSSAIDKIFLTENGRKMAQETYLAES